MSASGRVHDCKFIFAKEGRAYGVIVCGEVSDNENWLKGATESALPFSELHRLMRVILVGRTGQGNLPEFLPGTTVPLVVERNSKLAAEKVLLHLKAQ